jgi:cellulose synthase/poly-beta-1,6-N-acetylglucosamine synthase-like glycosyltransferase
MHRLIRSLARRRFVLSPAHSSDVQTQPQAGAWRATGALPSIDLSSSRADFPSGWVRLAIDIEVTEGDSAFGWVRADDGQGFREASSVRIPRASDGKVRLIVRLPDTVRALRYEPIKGQGAFALGPIEAQEIGWPEVFVRQMVRYCRGEGLSPIKALRAATFHVRVHGFSGLWAWMKQYLGGEIADKAYGPWVMQHDSWTTDGLRALERTASELRYRPKFSIVMPVHDTPERWLREAIDSVVGQAYDNWELCICDDNSAASHVPVVLDAYSRADPRIKVVRRAQSGHIAHATNDAMSLMTGEFMCLLDHDDTLAPHALFEFAKLLNEDSSIDLLYSDEDLITIDDVRYEPIIKPAWSPENLESYMYIGHLACYRADHARRIGGFRPEYSGAQDYDFALRYTEQATNIRHVAKILYHWRAVPGSVAVSIEKKDYVVTAARRALEQRLQRTGDTGSVVEQAVKGWFEMRRDVVGTPLVTVIVSDGTLEATHRGGGTDQSAICVESIRSKTTYRNYEIVTVKAQANRTDRLNEAAKQARGDYLVFVDSGTRLISGDWLQCMLRYAQRAGVGAVGAKLLFSDDTLRHVGIVFSGGIPRHVRQGYPESDRGYWGSSSIARNYLAVSDACMMVSREVFSSAGGLDSRIAAPFCHFDLCLKMVENGCRNVYVPSALLYQLGHQGWADDVDAVECFRKKWQHLTDPDHFYGANLALNPPTFEFDPDQYVGKLPHAMTS